MDFCLFRISLKAKESPDLFGTLGINGGDVSREAWLRFIFGSQVNFKHYNTPFVFRPEPDVTQAPPHLIFGWVAREKRRPERTPPEEGFEPTEHLGWEGAFAIIDPTEHDDGQKIAIEDNREIGTPKAILNSLVRQFQHDPAAPYYIHAFPLVSEGTFWDFSEAHNDQITSITFDVAVPNMFNSASDFEDELKSLRDEENVATLKSQLESVPFLHIGLSAL